MNALQADILQTIARLSNGFDFYDSNGGDLPGYTHGHAHNGVPSLLLWMEYWTFRMKQTQAARNAFDRCVESLIRQKLITSKQAGFMASPIPMFYRTAEGVEWRIEFRSRDVRRAPEVSADFEVWKCRMLTVAAPVDKWNEFDAYLTEAPHLNCLNLFTESGMQLDARQNPSYSVTEGGWDRSNLCMDDLKSEGIRADGGSASSTRVPKGKRGRKSDTDHAEDKRLADGWRSAYKEGNVRTKAEYAREKGVTEQRVKDAVDRHRKR